jgi:hypothetical protein
MKEGGDGGEVGRKEKRKRKREREANSCYSGWCPSSHCNFSVASIR